VERTLTIYSGPLIERERDTSKILRVGAIVRLDWKRQDGTLFMTHFHVWLDRDEGTDAVGALRPPEQLLAALCQRARDFVALHYREMPPALSPERPVSVIIEEKRDWHGQKITE
jgi:hypothetical protein